MDHGQSRRDGGHILPADAFINPAFEGRKQRGHNATDVKRHIRFIADRRFTPLGLQPIDGGPEGLEHGAVGRGVCAGEQPEIGARYVLSADSTLSLIAA